MATTEAPDPRTFKSWEDAFAYPIPVVQKLEHQLRGHAAENRDKLRSLVGASYRDLLTTAETIISMEERMALAETRMARIGRNANSRTIDGIARTTARSHARNRQEDREKFTFASQTAVLRAAPGVMTRLMKDKKAQGEGCSLLGIAKVLVLSRLLYGALSKRVETKKEGACTLVEELRERIASARRKLLRRVDRRLGGGEGEIEVEGLVQAMCAYALATSSTPSDVLRHFQHVRMERILLCLRGEKDEDGNEGKGKGKGLKERGVEALKLCLKTTQDAQAIFPKRLADALARLKLQPLVQDQVVRACWELNLEVHERWIGEEARNYTPQPRNDELQRAEAERLTGVWGKQAISAFLKEIKKVLGEETDLKEVAELRQELVETWLVQGSRMAGVKRRNVLDDLREAMNGQLQAIVRSRTQSLKAVVDVIKEILEAWQGQTESLSLWSTTAAAADLSNGARTFKETILNTHQGRDESVIRVVAKYDEWMKSVLEVKCIVKHMKETRWDDPFSDDIDLDESDDETADMSKQTLLSSDDPKLLEEVTEGALSDALSSLGKSFASISDNLAEGDKKTDDTKAVPKAIFLLRVIREISDRIPRLLIQDRSSPLASPFSSEILNPLHLALANKIAQPLLEAYRLSLAASLKHRSNGHILWEGQPPLPAQPSPSAFRFLRDLVKDMAKYGSDLWVSEGVSVLKELVEEEIVKVWTEHADSAKTTRSASPDSDRDTEKKEASEDGESVDGGAKGDANGDANGEASKNTSQPTTAAATDTANQKQTERLKQLAFDLLYIRRFLAKQGISAAPDLDSNAQPWTTVCEAAALDEGLKMRLSKSAGDYVRKTYLLFALLA